MPGGLTLLISANADIPTPAAGKVTIFFSTEENGPAYKDDTGTVFPLEGPTGSSGPPGPAGFGFDGEDGDAPLALPGPQGNPGTTGSAGPIGPMFVMEDGLEGEQGFPGPPGSAGGGSEFTTVRKTADQQLANVTTLTSDTELLTPALDINSVYAFEQFIIYSGNNTSGDYQWQWLSSQTIGQVAQWFGEHLGLSSSALAAQNPTGVIAASTTRWPLTAPNIGTDATDAKLILRASFTIVTGGVAPILTYQFAAVGAGAGRTCTTYAGSYIRYKKVS